MLISYPQDYRSNEEIGDTIKSFGRLLFWQRDNVLARIIIKARVTDLIDIPHYIIISEGDFLKGYLLLCSVRSSNKICLEGCLRMRIYPLGAWMITSFSLALVWKTPKSATDQLATLATGPTSEPRKCGGTDS
jgi:hypothetical protein